MIHADTPINLSTVNSNTLGVSIPKVMTVLQTPINDHDEFKSLDDETNSSFETDQVFNTIVSQFEGKLDQNHINDYSDTVVEDLNEALFDNSPISMLPNFNINPTGREQGKFLVIDLGGSTLRIASVEIKSPISDNDDEVLRSNRINVINEKKWIVSNQNKLINYEFFKFIGSKMIETIKEQDTIKLEDDVVDVGITWSFPLNQDSHNSGKIVHVGKGWVISDEIHNKDLKTILEGTLKTEFDLTIDVKVVINDSLAVYAAGKFLSANLKLAMVLGTGFNMCCSLNTSDKMHKDKTLGQKAILVNSETSLFGSSLFELVNEFDQVIDLRFSTCQRPFKSHMTTGGSDSFVFQPFEIMTSGRYLPELIRLSIVKLLDNNEMFQNIPSIASTSKLFTKYDGFSGELLCFISETQDLSLIQQKFNEEFSFDINKSDTKKLKQLVDVVIERGSYTIAIAVISYIKLVAIHNKEDLRNKTVIIGYVGSIMVYFNNYRHLINKYINESEYVKQLGMSVDLMSIDNSSIVGAAVGAAFFK